MTTVRRAGTTSAAALSAIILALGLAHAAAPQWTERIGLDIWNLFHLREQTRDHDRERERLKDREEQLGQEIEALDHLANRLSAGTLSLAEATDVAEPMMRNRTGFETAAELNYPAPTFRLSVARFLIARTGRTLETDPSRWAAVSSRLEAEYASMK
jgi:hypothetical protein